MKQTSGFTLAEVLIVATITAILVAISVPIFKGKREQALIATNRANIRAAAAEIISEQQFTSNGQADVYSLYEVKYDILNNRVVPEELRNDYVDGIQKPDGKIYRFSKDGLVQWVYFRFYILEEGEFEYYHLPFYDESKLSTHDMQKIFNLNHYDALDYFDISISK